MDISSFPEQIQGARKSPARKKNFKERKFKEARSLSALLHFQPSVFSSFLLIPVPSLM
jgi:hypothetical protein